MDSREEISELLTLEGKIDLAIPRGGQDLVRAVMEMSSGRLPVLGHTEGVCHVFLDQYADLEKALRIGKMLHECNLTLFFAQYAVDFPHYYCISHVDNGLCSIGLQVQLSCSLQCIGESSGAL